MKCVCKHCLKVVELEEPKYDSMSDAFWGGKCPNCNVYDAMWEIDKFIKYRNKLNSVKIDSNIVNEDWEKVTDPEKLELKLLINIC